MDDATRQKAEKDMRGSGLISLAEFIRMMIRQWPFRDGKQWSDRDMKDFAQQYSHRPPEEPYVLENEDNRLTRALEKFKTSH